MGNFDAFAAGINPEMLDNVTSVSIVVAGKPIEPEAIRSMRDTLLLYSEWLDGEGLMKPGPESHTQLIDKFAEEITKTPRSA